MLLNHTSIPAEPEVFPVLSFARLVSAVRTAARQRGIKGDPLDFGAPMGTAEVELAALDIFHALPREISRWDKDLATKMCRAVVRTHGGTR